MINGTEHKEIVLLDYLSSKNYPVPTNQILSELIRCPLFSNIEEIEALLETLGKEGKIEKSHGLINTNTKWSSLSHS